jgi:hypothetical protein
MSQLFSAQDNFAKIGHRYCCDRQTAEGQVSLSPLLHRLDALVLLQKQYLRVTFLLVTPQQEM